MGNREASSFLRGLYLLNVATRKCPTIFFLPTVQLFVPALACTDKLTDFLYFSNVLTYLHISTFIYVC